LIDLIIGILLSVVLILASITDLRHEVIPDKLTYGSIIIGLLIRYFYHDQSFMSYIICSFIVGGIMYLAAIISNGNIGGGDIKIVAFIGLLIGFPLIYFALFVSFLIASIYGIFVLIRHGKIKVIIPAAPFLAIGTLIIFWGKPYFLHLISNIQVLANY
jgi:Flp pilus assembly protein protease CpaA